ncbi:MAG TPA: ABC transporter permease [Bryobacteraceae bacterium]|nr:ABC transporter permease [Bryobacteraceae bacterium]
MLDTILQDVRYALRAIRKSPGFAAVAILSVSLGIGANTAIFSLINSLILKTLPVAHPEQLLQLTIGKDTGFTNPIWEQIRDRQDVFAGIFASGGARFNLAAGGEARYARGNYASGDFFTTLGLQAVAGRTFTTADDKRGCPGTAVLNYGFWQREYAGRADIVGKAISLDNHPFEIIGVLAPGFSGIEVGSETDLYVPICTEKIVRGEFSSLDQRSSWWLRVIGRPKPGVSPSQAAARLTVLAPQVFEATVPPRWKAEDQQNYRKRSLNTLPAANGLSYLRRQYQHALMVLMVIVGAVLLIACANVANLLLARAAARQKEVAVRIALGSGRGRLIRQLMTESVVLSLAGAVLGTALAQWGARLLVRLLSLGDNKVVLDLSIDLRVLAFTAGVSILTALIFGLAPAWRSSAVNPQSAMKANARGVIEGSRFRIGKALVVAQVALSLVLVVGAGLMLATFFKLETLDAGFDRQHVLLVSVDLRNGNYAKERRGVAMHEMLDRLRTLPGVQAASVSNMTPISGSFWNNNLEIEGYTAKSRDDTLVYFNEVSDRYFETMGMKLLAGRDFNEHDTPESPKVAIVNQTMAKRYFPGQDPVGKRFRSEAGASMGPWHQIVGVVRDSKYGSLREEILPTAFVASNQDATPMWYQFEVRSAVAPAALIPVAKSAIAEVNRDVSLQFRMLALQVEESLARERLLATLSGFFGALALALAMLGLYGVMSYNVARRRNEIGIRMALGAAQSRLLRMVLSEVALLIGIGLAVGLAATIGTTRFVESFLYGTKVNDPWTISLAAGLLAAVAAVAGFLPARSASRLDPMNALRDE